MNNDREMAIERRTSPESRFGLEYVVERLVKSVDLLGAKIEAMATKGEVAMLFAKLDEKADSAALAVIDTRLTRIERNQLPPWFVGVLAIVATVVVAIALHYWK